MNLTLNAVIPILFSLPLCLLTGWERLLIQAGKTNDNGHIYLSEGLSYTVEMLATLFCRPLDSIKNALEILSSFQMIEIAPNNIIKIVNWDKHQNIEGMEKVRVQNRKRAENHREKKRQMEQNAEEIRFQNQYNFQRISFIQ